MSEQAVPSGLGTLAAEAVRLAWTPWLTVTVIATRQRDGLKAGAQAWTAAHRGMAETWAGAIRERAAKRAITAQSTSGRSQS